MVDFTTAAGYTTDSSGRRQFEDRDKANGVSGTSLVADDQNMDRNELVNAVLGSGQVLDGTNHAQLALAIQALGNIRPWSQVLSNAIGGYWLGAVIVDGSGAFWQSTKAANTTAPGAAGANWKSLFDGLATIEALNTEAEARTAADAALSNSKVNRSGDTMSGPLITALPNPDNTAGATNYGPAFISRVNANTDFRLYMQETNGVSAFGVMFLTSAGNTQYFNYGIDGSITSGAGAFALQSAVNMKVSKAGDTLSGPLVAALPSPSNAAGAQNFGPAFISRANADTELRMYSQETNGASAGGVLFLTSAGNSQYFDYSMAGRIVSGAGTFALMSDLPFSNGLKSQIFTVTIPAGTAVSAIAAGIVEAIPSAFTNFQFAFGSDTGTDIYTVACTPNDNASVKIFARSSSKTSGTLAVPMILVIAAYGTY